MATFISHPLFGAGVSYLLQRPQAPSPQSLSSAKRFILLSTLCQSLPDIDTLSYLFSIDEQHSLGHRGFMHSGAFALVLAYAVMTIFYRPLKSNRRQWWRYYIWFFFITLTHGIFDALVHTSLGVAFFWPLDTHRYLFTWQPLVDVPVRFSAFFGSHFWYAQWVECQFFSLLLASIYVSHRLIKHYLRRPPTPVSASMQALTPKSPSSV